MTLEVQSSRINTNLPASITSLIGRRAEKAALNQLLADPQTRIVTLLAPGGMGKTLLALEVARQQLGEFSDGVYAVTLSTFLKHEELAILIADAINCQIYSDQNVEQQVLSNLSPQHVLLLIDNAEYVTHSTAFLTDILRAAPHVKVLAISQVKLNLYDEKIFSLGGLSFATGDAATENADDAITLFVERARNARRNFQLTPESRQAISDICTLTQGMPLALVLAASWTALLSPAEIVSELSRGFDFLETDLQDMPSRQRSIRAVYDYTWTLMGDDERQMLTRLSIFRRGFTREAAQIIAQGNLRSLMGLLNRAVIQPSAYDRHMEIHELLRLYSEEQLRRSGEYETFRSIHSRYFLGLVEQNEQNLKGVKQVEILDLLQADEENIELAWQWAIVRHETSLLMDAIEGLFWYHFMRNRYLIFEIISRNIENEFSRSHNADDVLLVARAQVRNLWMLRWSEGTVARHPEIIEQLEQQIILFRDFDAVHELALCELLLGDAVRTLENDRERAQSLLKSASDRFGTLKDEYHFAWTLHFIARLMGDTQGIQNGIETLNRALVLRRKLGDQIGAIYSLYNLSTDLLLLGDLDKCREVTEEILNISRVTREQSSLLLGQITLTLLAFLEGQFEIVRAQNAINRALAGKLNHLLGLAWTNLIQMLLDYLDERPDYPVENLGRNQKFAVQSVVGYFYALAYPFIQITDDELFVQNLRNALRHADEFAAYGAQCLCLPFLAALEATREHFIQAAQLLALAEAQPHNLMGWLPAWLERTSLKGRIAQKLAIETLEDAYELGRALDIPSVIRSFMNTNTERGKTTSLIQQHIWEANKTLVEPLSERELEVLAYIGKGLSNQEIANEMVVELSTVKKHLTHIYDKLDVGTRAQAILRAQERHLI